MFYYTQLHWRRIAFALPVLLTAVACAAAPGKRAFVGGTVINPATESVIPNAVVLVDGETIESVGPASGLKPPPDAEVIDCAGKWIVPGYIDTHVHFFQSGGLFTRPDIVDLRAVRSYQDEHAWIESNLADTFVRYLRCGVTSVIDVGGPLWNFTVRDVAQKAAKAPRVAVAGPLISSVARPQLVLDGDAPIIQIKTPAEGVQLVEKLADKKPAYIKIWYVVTPDSPVDKFRPIVRAVIEESHRRRMRAAVHATELETARVAVQEGADLLVHSVNDEPVDEAFIELLQERKTILTPTLVVFERYGQTFAGKLNLTREETAWANPEVLATLDVTKIPEEKRPMRINDALAQPDETLARIEKTLGMALQNLRRLHDAGITIAAGTDAGNIGTPHGPAIFREFELMREAGLTPMQILKCATVNGARAFGGETGDRLGAVERGKLADLVILNSNPLADITRASDIHRVISNGNSYSPESILAEARK